MSREIDLSVLGTTLCDGYYSKVLPVLVQVVGICDQAGLPVPSMNTVRDTEDAKLEGVFYDLGPGRELSCRAARYHDAEHKVSAGIVLWEKNGSIAGRAKISVLYEPIHRKWWLYAQIQPGCRSDEMRDLCALLSIDISAETSKEATEVEAYSMILSTAKWAAGVVAAAKGAVSGELKV